MSAHLLRDHGMKLGRSERSLAPKIKLRDFVDIEKAAASPVPLEQSVDYATLVSSWPMFLNDALGDCTCAGAAHAVQTFAAMAGDPFTVTDADVERMYEAAGYEPSKAEPGGENPTDQGWTLEAAEGYLKTTGLQGEANIETGAEVTLHDEEEEQVALELFGCLYEGMECPESALTQAQEGKPWTPVAGSKIAGGHCVIRPKSVLGQTGYHVSWGTLIPATDAFDKEYFDEYRVFVPKNWEAKLPEAVLKLGIVDFSKLSSLVTQFSS
jgi:hypothetical protein